MIENTISGIPIYSSNVYGVEPISRILGGMDQSEFSKLLTHDEIAKNEVMSVLSDDSFIYKAITPSRANTRLNDNAPDENSKSSLSKYNIILKQVGNDLAD